MTPEHDIVLVYDHTGCHLMPLADLGYGPDLDAAVSQADAQETLCVHDQVFVELHRQGGWTDPAIAAALGVLVCALPARPRLDLLGQLHAAAERSAA